MGEPQKKTEIVAYLVYEGDAVTSPRTLLAAAILTLNVATHGNERFVQTMDARGDTAVFTNLWTFEPLSRDGLYKTNQLIAWWDDAEWLLAHPEHPLTILRRGLAEPSLLDCLPSDSGPESARSYLAQGLENLQRITLALAAVVPLIKITRGQRSVFIPANASPAETAKLMAIFDRK